MPVPLLFFCKEVTKPLSGKKMGEVICMGTPTPPEICRKSGRMANLTNGLVRGHFEKFIMKLGKIKGEVYEGEKI